ncbi:HD domain-containing phosphohydrolase [Ruminococcus sp.]|uniref:HD domain-containing phosphohydrolase n=1 Tax=Ruminococcus sp. TaxID=41978 RepID=UPI003866E39F
MKKIGIKKLNDNFTKGGVFSLLGISLIILLLTVAVYFVAHYVANSYTDENRFSNWNYLYTEKAGSVPDGELRTYNAQNPIITEGKKGNIYFTKTLEPSDKASNFVLITDFAPVKILLNGKEIYNNQFDTAEYVGNCYNAVTLEPSTQERQLEVMLKLPLSVRFETYLNPPGDPAFTNMPGFMIGLIMMGVGLLAAIVFGILSAVKKRLFRSIVVSGLLFYVGLALALYMLPEVTYLFNTPKWMNITALPVHLTFMVVLLCLNGLFKGSRNTAIAILFASGISAIAVLVAFNPLTVKLAILLMCLLTTAAAVYVARTAMVQLDRRIQYAAPVFVMCVFCVMVMVLAAIFMSTRQRFLYIYNVTISSIVIMCVLEYIYIHDFRQEQQTIDVRDQSVKYSKSVEGISQFIRNMLDCHDKSKFYDTAVREILDLIVKYNPDNTDIRYCVAVKDGDTYTEVVNNGIASCNYEMIEQNGRKNDKECLFAGTYFEYILKNKDEVGAVFHFENIKDGMDVFFISMIEATYCSLVTTYEDIFTDGTHRDINVIFAELAENTELDNGCSVDHLINIRNNSRELCLRIGIDEERAEHISIASELHDLGKIAVPKDIIHKEGRLTEEERVMINSHTEFGYTILSAYDDDPILATAAVIARYHHERYDGTGNNGLKGEDIPVEARVVTVCDVYDALISERTYKKPWSKEDAIHYLKENEGKLFDPDICEKFIAFIGEEAEAKKAAAAQ